MTRYRIFISSTIDDLQEARTGVATDLASMEIFEPIRAESLPAVDEPSRQVCFKEVRQADAIVLLLGQRYGFIPTTKNPAKLSVTHLEYREAKRHKKPIFAFINDSSTPDHQLTDFIKEVSD